MEITDVKIRKIQTEGKMKGVASVTFDDVFAVHDIKIIETDDKLFIAMPSKKTEDNRYRDIAHPTESNMRKELSDAVIAKYKEALQNYEHTLNDAN
jgi:stage V sporulation protein G